MTKLRFEVPSMEHKERAIEYIMEFRVYDSPINGAGSLQRYYDNYEGWLEKLDLDRNSPVTKEKVPAETYFLVREEDNKIIGMSNIRLELNEDLKKSGGHIGYAIRPTERRKGYNKINLYYALQVLQNHGVKEAMLDCNIDNYGSENTMKALGGRYDRTVVDFRDGDEIKIYYIDVDKSLKQYRYLVDEMEKRKEC